MVKTEVDLWAELDQYLILCGMALQSRQKAWKYFPRWIRRLRAEGHTSIGHLAVARTWTWDEIQTGNWIDMILADRSGNKAVSHDLHTLTGVRSPKV